MVHIRCSKSFIKHKPIECCFLLSNILFWTGAIMKCVVYNLDIDLPGLNTDAIFSSVGDFFSYFLAANMLLCLLLIKRLSNKHKLIILSSFLIAIQITSYFLYIDIDDIAPLGIININNKQLIENPLFTLLITALSLFSILAAILRNKTLIFLLVCIVFILCLIVIILISLEVKKSQNTNIIPFHIAYKKVTSIPWNVVMQTKEEVALQKKEDSKEAKTFTKAADLTK